MEEEEQFQKAEGFTEIYVWGNDYHGQLGVGFERTSHSVPKICSFNILIRQVSCGDDHTAFIVEPQGQVYTMGSNTDGKLGIGQHTITHSNVPCLVDNLSGIVKVACGGGHTLAISSTGQAFSWGQGYNGALGLNETGNQDRPRIITVPISTQRVIDIAAGSRHSLFLTDQQKVYSCGESKLGQLGLGPLNTTAQDKILLPMNIKSLNEHFIKRVCTGKHHSMFLTSQGQILACGNNTFGQLGIGSKANQFSPVLVEGLSDVKEVSAWHYSAAITNQGELYVWGTGIFGEQLKPHCLKELTGAFKEIKVGGSFSILVGKDNKGYVWGQSPDYQYAKDTTQSPSIIQTLEEKEVVSLAVGDSFAFMLGQNMRMLEEEEQPGYEEPPQPVPHSQRQSDGFRSSRRQSNQSLGGSSQRAFGSTSRHQTNTVASLEAKIAELQATLRAKEQTIARLKEENAKLTMDFDKLITKQKEEAEQARRTEQDLRQQVQYYKDKCVGLPDPKVTRELQNLKDQNERLREEIDKLRLYNQSKDVNLQPRPLPSYSAGYKDFLLSPSIGTNDYKLSRHQDDEISLSGQTKTQIRVEGIKDYKIIKDQDSMNLSGRINFQYKEEDHWRSKPSDTMLKFERTQGNPAYKIESLASPRYQIQDKFSHDHPLSHRRNEVPLLEDIRRELYDKQILTGRVSFEQQAVSDAYTLPEQESHKAVISPSSKYEGIYSHREQEYRPREEIMVSPRVIFSAEKKSEGSLMNHYRKDIPEYNTNSRPACGINIYNSHSVESKYIPSANHQNSTYQTAAIEYNQSSGNQASQFNLRPLRSDNEVPRLLIPPNPSILPYGNSSVTPEPNHAVSTQSYVINPFSSRTQPVSAANSNTKIAEEFQPSIIQNQQHQYSTSGQTQSQSGVEGVGRTEDLRAKLERFRSEREKSKQALLSVKQTNQV